MSFPLQRANRRRPIRSVFVERLPFIDDVQDAEAQSQLYGTALALLADTVKQRELGQNIRALGRPDAAAAIVNEILKLIP